MSSYTPCEGGDGCCDVIWDSTDPGLTGPPLPPDNPNSPSEAYDETTGEITHVWNVTTQSWVPVPCCHTPCPVPIQVDCCTAAAFSLDDAAIGGCGPPDPCETPVISTLFQHSAGGDTDADGDDIAYFNNNQDDPPGTFPGQGSYIEDDNLLFPNAITDAAYTPPTVAVDPCGSIIIVTFNEGFAGFYNNSINDAPDRVISFVQNGTATVGAFTELIDVPFYNFNDPGNATFPNPGDTGERNAHHKIFWAPLTGAGTLDLEIYAANPVSPGFNGGLAMIHVHQADKVNTAAPFSQIVNNVGGNTDEGAPPAGNWIHEDEGAAFPTAPICPTFASIAASHVDVVNSAWPEGMIGLDETDTSNFDTPIDSVLQASSDGTPDVCNAGLTDVLLPPGQQTLQYDVQANYSDPAGTGQRYLLMVSTIMVELACTPSSLSVCEIDTCALEATNPCEEDRTVQWSADADVDISLAAGTTAHIEIRIGGVLVATTPVTDSYSGPLSGVLPANIIAALGTATETATITVVVDSYVSDPSNSITINSFCTEGTVA